MADDTSAADVTPATSSSNTLTSSFSTLLNSLSGSIPTIAGQVINAQAAKDVAKTQAKLASSDAAKAQALALASAPRPTTSVFTPKNIAIGVGVLAALGLAVYMMKKAK